MRTPLSPEERRQLETLFERASDLPAIEHAPFIERECAGNEGLRAELERLLAASAGEDLLGRMRTEAPSRAGMLIGPYKLLERIGQGGMGEVYAAQQLEPIARRVALKIIKPGMDSAQVVARFEAERQALARMTHPHIAQVYDGGRTPDGRPYFVMELVAGEPLNEYCDRRRLSTRARLELFRAICDGVGHAHQKGIIHRDLKPSNLLVAEQDGRALPKVIDFGVARATTGSLAERTLHTMVGQVVGTLHYMSPEQADPSGVDIDTRSDVYSLGVVLYQLLSGLLPFDRELAADLPFSAVQRTLREKDPPTPSTRLRRESATVTSLAPLHGVDPRALIRQLSGDLDWICIKALEKDPARRYQSVAELAEDVGRHLDHKPVLAGRPGALYRSRKFVRRHRVAVAAGALVAASTVAGAFGIVSGRLEALSSARVAEMLRPAGVKQDLELLLRRADDELWPPFPDRIDDLQAWLDEARVLALTRPEYQARLETLRARALERTPEERKRDHDGDGRIERLGDARAQLELQTRRALEADSSVARDRAEARIAALESEIEALEQEGALRRTWTFADPEDRFRHDQLAGLVELLTELGDDATGLLGADAVSPEHGWSVPKRLAVARELEASCVRGGAYDEAWTVARAAIREHPRYGGLDLKPQMGLLPLGPDPDSGLWEFAELLTGEPAVRSAKDGRLELTEETGLSFVLILGGSFIKGAQGHDPDAANYYALADESEGPPVEVPALEPFFVSKYEMTQGQWKRITGSNPTGGPEDLLKPANQVTWRECDRTLFRLGLRLPSEEEWEYVARAGTPGEWPWATGPDEASLQGRTNLLDESLPERLRSIFVAHGLGLAVPWNDAFRAAAPVGTFPANPWGLHDVYGNVSEWTASVPTRYDTGASDRQGRTLRMIRGSNWKAGSEAARPAFRGFKNGIDLTLPTLGVRPARSIDS